MTESRRFTCDRCGAEDNEDCTWLRLIVQRSEQDLFRPMNNRIDLCSECERLLVQWRASGPLERLTRGKP